MWFFYIPVVLYIAYLTIRHRGLLFTVVNPGMPASGFLGESKSDSLLALQNKVPENTALTGLIPRNKSAFERKLQCLAFMEKHRLDYPIILKPDSGQRGEDVAIIKDELAIGHYLATARCDTIVQPYIAGVEFGVFYYRQPDSHCGSIFSLTHKCFPFVSGDGVKTLEELILLHPRLHYMARFLLDLHRDNLRSVPAQGEIINVVRIGSHCRGSLFLDGQQYVTQQLGDTIDHISQQLPDFYFGRYDVRASSIEDFQQGRFKVIEVNGVTSESTNIYDPKYSVFAAYRIMFVQWRLAFSIGEKNKEKGHTPLSLFELLYKTHAMNREARA
jgi:hypothetical protein